MLSTLRVFALYKNELTGPIPADYFNGGRSQLWVFDVASNSLSGTFPFATLNATSLKNLDIRSNKIGGTLGSEIGRLTNLVAIKTAGNLMEGSIPSEIGMLSLLGESQNPNLYKNTWFNRLMCAFSRPH